ncbi:MAG TPA: hypothetical protein VHM01_23805 [Alphaproteobacteria bacterium]|nr:hypothetical protein [Alphaproteobacteria bacterium]
MQWKLALVVSLLAAAPAAAQIAVTPTPPDDQTRPRRGFVTPEEQQRLDERERQRQEQQGRVRAPEEYNALRTYEGRATFTGTRPGKCPMNGSVRASVRGNIIDASVTFPIERDAVHGFISGSRFEARGNFGYTFQGAVTDQAITGVVTKRQTVKPAEKPKPGVAIPFLPGPTTTAQPPGPPLIQDCSYQITLSRVDTGPPPTQR